MHLEIAALEVVVAKVLGARSISVQSWNARDLESELGGGGRVRLISGIALHRGGSVPWKVVLKEVAAPIQQGEPLRETGARVADHNYWNRESLLYESGLLRDLRGGLAAPKCFGVTSPAPDVRQIWLEALTDGIGRPWRLARYGVAARHLGQFNAMTVLEDCWPDRPWMSRNWTDGWMSRWSFLRPLAQSTEVWEHPLVKPAFPAEARRRLLNLLSRYHALGECLRGLPQVFCHRDPNRSNLIAVDTPGASRTLAIDWEFSGWGAIGEDAAQLVVSSLLRGTMGGADRLELDREVFDGYISGLRQAGWVGDPKLVRLGYSASVALRWGLPCIFGLVGVFAEHMRPVMERRFGCPYHQLVEQWGAATSLVLDFSDEALGMIDGVVRLTHPVRKSPFPSEI